MSAIGSHALTRLALALACLVAACAGERRGGPNPDAPSYSSVGDGQTGKRDSLPVSGDGLVAGDTTVDSPQALDAPLPKKDSASGCTAACNGKLCGAADGCGGNCLPGSGCCAPQCSGKACGASDGCNGTCSAGSGCCTPSCSGKTCGSGDGCGGTCNAGSGCCTPQCSGKLCGAGNGCGGSCGSGSGCCTPSCSGKACGAGDGCGGTCSAGNNGDHGDSCSGFPAESWRCVQSAIHGVKISQVCRAGIWQTYHLSPQNCGGCCGAYSGACE